MSYHTEADWIEFQLWLVRTVERLESSTLSPEALRAKIGNLPMSGQVAITQNDGTANNGVYCAYAVVTMD